MPELSQNTLDQSRSGFLFTYAQITFNQFRRYEILVRDREKFVCDRQESREKFLVEGNLPKQPEDQAFFRTFTREYEFQAEERECRILAILAATLFLEAFIWDYGARKESGRFAKTVDKLDPVSKWIVIPRLIFAPGLDQSHDAFGRLRALFRARNDLVHHKTKEGGDIEVPPNLPEHLDPSGCVQLIIDMLELIHALDEKDHFTTLVLRHISSWPKHASMDSGFYPVMWEA